MITQRGLEIAVEALRRARDTISRDDPYTRADIDATLARIAALRSQQEPEGKITAAMLKAFHIANGDTLPCSGDTVKDADAWATHLLTRALFAAPTEAEGGALMQAYAMGQRWMELMAEGNETAAADVSERFGELLARPIRQAPSGEGAEAVHQWRTVGGRWWYDGLPFPRWQGHDIETRTLYTAPVVRKEQS